MRTKLFYRRGFAVFKDGKEATTMLKEAKGNFDECLRLDPKNSAAKKALGDVENAILLAEASAKAKEKAEKRVSWLP